MKLVVQTLVLGIVAVGASAAIGSSYRTIATPSGATTVSAMPVPNCNPGKPCGTGSGNGQ